MLIEIRSTDLLNPAIAERLNLKEQIAATIQGGHHLLHAGLVDLGGETHHIAATIRARIRKHTLIIQAGGCQWGYGCFFLHGPSCCCFMPSCAGSDCQGPISTPDGPKPGRAAFTAGKRKI